MNHVRTTKAAKFHAEAVNYSFFEPRRRPSTSPRMAGWTVIKGKPQTRSAGARRLAPAILDARGFANALASELKSSRIHRSSFAVLIVRVRPDELLGAEASSRVAEIMNGKKTHDGAAARLGPNRLGVMLRGVDAKSATAVSQELCLRLRHLGFDSVEVDGGIFPDDIEMLRGLRRALAR